MSCRSTNGKSNPKKEWKEKVKSDEKRVSRKIVGHHRKCTRRCRTKGVGGSRCVYIYIYILSWKHSIKK